MSDFLSQAAVTADGASVFKNDMFAVGQRWEFFLSEGGAAIATITGLDAYRVWYIGNDGKRRTDTRGEFHNLFPRQVKSLSLRAERNQRNPSQGFLRMNERR